MARSEPGIEHEYCPLKGMHVLMVRVRGESFGIPTSEVIEVIRAVAVKPLPGAPTVISGVINVRGEIIVVMDPAVRFGHPETPVSPDDNFVLTRAGRRTLAIRVEAADDLTKIDDDSLTGAKAASPTLEKLHGVATMPDGPLVIYDVAAFLTQAEDEAIAEALATASATTA